MTTGTVIVRGVVQGKTIELEREPGIAERQPVSVVLRPALPPGEGLRQAFGSWSDSQGLEQFIEGVYRDREGDRIEPQP
jgi:hypothetical protein